MARRSVASRASLTGGLLRVTEWLRGPAAATHAGPVPQRSQGRRPGARR
jgi:hypothetical protein